MGCEGSRPGFTQPCPVTLNLPSLALGFPRCNVGGEGVGGNPSALTCLGLSQRVQGGGRESLFHVVL